MLFVFSGRSLRRRESVKYLIPDAVTDYNTSRNTISLSGDQLGLAAVQGRITQFGLVQSSIMYFDHNTTFKHFIAALPWFICTASLQYYLFH